VISIIYKHIFKPFLFALSGPGQQCRYPVSCSEYAKRKFQKESFVKAFCLSIKRVVSCNPWTSFKLDKNEEF